MKSYTPKFYLILFCHLDKDDRKGFSLVDIKLNLNKKTADETIATLERLAEGKRRWRN